jgi:hypothetical protein
MDKTAPDSQDPVTQVLGQLLRHPEPQRDIELERALVRLQAARSDAPYLLMHRVMVLEAALQQVQARAALVRAETITPATGPGPMVAPRPAASRSFLRDAAVVTAGVVAGQALWQGLVESPVEGIDGLDVDGWL